MEIKDIIYNRRKELRLTLLDIAKACDVSEATVSRWERGEIDNMKRDKISLLADVLKISPLTLIGLEEDLPNDVFPIQVSTLYQVPLFEYIPASCGLGSWSEDDVFDYIGLPTSIYKFNKNKKYFGQIADGDSMSGLNIDSGDLLIFEQLNTPEDNMVGVFSIDNEKCLCKKIKISDEKIYLLSANDKYLPIEITKEMNFRMVGKLKYIVKEYKG